jgi:NADP-dependent 3-hydroxy acid dehydrogenase YdfG
VARTALIFGHTSGLGRALSERLLRRGDTVVGIARSGLSQEFSGLTEIACDLSQPADVEAAIDQIRCERVHFDLLIYSAGTLVAHEIDALEAASLVRLYQVNLFAPMMIESRLVDLCERNGADVVNITSSAIHEYYPEFTEYATAKTALAKFTDDLRRRLRPTAARVIEFCPSGFTSEMYSRMEGQKIVRDEAVQMRAEDVADLLVSVIDLPKNIEVGQIYVNRK